MSVIGYTKSAIDSLLAQLAQDSTVVHLAGGETITGAKTFSVSPAVPTPASGSAGSAAAVPRSYVDSLSIPSDPLLMHLAGAETVTGVKTFNAPPVVPSPTGSTQAAPKSYVDSQIASIVSSGGTNSPYPPLGYYSAGLTASTQAQATANTNAIARANTTALTNAVANVPLGVPIFIPAVGTGSAYYFASPVTITRSGVAIIGSGYDVMSDIGTGQDGGSTFKDIPGFSGNAVIIIDNAYHTSLRHMIVTAGTTKACVIDNGNGSIFMECGLAGGTEAAFDCRNANQAPYNMALTANQGGKRMDMNYCMVTGLNSSAGTYCCYIGVDAVVTGGRMTSGTKCLIGSGILMTGVHFTGGSPLLECQDTRNTVTGCQLDGASAIALVRVNGSLTLNGCLFYNSVSSFSGGTAIPMILNNGSAGVRINGGLVSSNAGSPAYSFLTQYVGATANAVTSTVIRDLLGCSSGNFTSLWDGSGAPGKYSLYDGTTWHTDANTGTR
jgi:hypothetical protein